MTGVTSVILMLLEFEYSVNVGKNVQIKREWLGEILARCLHATLSAKSRKYLSLCRFIEHFFLSRQVLNKNHGGIENMNGLDYHGPFFKQLSILYVFFSNSQIDWMFIILFFHQP